MKAFIVSGFITHEVSVPLRGDPTVCSLEQKTSPFEITMERTVYPSKQGICGILLKSYKFTKQSDVSVFNIQELNPEQYWQYLKGEQS